MTVSDQVGYLFDYGCKDLSNFIGTETNPAYGDGTCRVYVTLEFQY